MSRRKIFLVISTILFLTAGSGFIPFPILATETTDTMTDSRCEYEEGTVIVTLASPHDTSLTIEGKDSVNPQITVEECFDFGTAESLGTTRAQRKSLENKSLYIVKATSDSYSTADLIDELKNRSYVISAEPDYKYKRMDTLGSHNTLKKNAARISDNTSRGCNDFQWYLNGGNASSAGIRHKDFDQDIIREEPVVAVVDSGIDFTHEALKDHMWVNTSDNLEGTYGYDCAKNVGDPVDTDGHGTCCAGIIGACDGENGFCGISRKVKMMALNIYNSDDKATVSNVIKSFEYIYRAQQQGVHIVAVNCSWGGGKTTTAERALIEKIGQLGALFVFSAGNAGKNQDEETTWEEPFDIDSDYLVIIGASNTSDQPAVYSNYGKKHVDFFAPGSQILSTVPYENFYPLLLDTKKRKDACFFFSSGEEGDIALSDFYGVQKITHVKDDVYGNTKSGSYFLEFDSSLKPSNKFTPVYMDVTDYDLSSAEVFYGSCDTGYRSGDEIIWESTLHKIYPQELKEVNGRTYAPIAFVDDDTTYFDNLAISRQELSDEYFVKYDQFSGTSMSAPVVSGAIAVLAGLRVNDNSLERKETLFRCLRMNDSFADKAIRGGMLDMSKMSEITPDLVPATPLPTQTPNPSHTPQPTPAPQTTPPAPNAGNSSGTNGHATGNSNAGKTKKIPVRKIKLNKKKTTLKFGKKLKLKVRITPKNATNKKVRWYVSGVDGKYIKVSQKGIVTARKRGIGRRIKIYAMTKDGSKKKSFCTVRITK